MHLLLHVPTNNYTSQHSETDRPTMKPVVTKSSYVSVEKLLSLTWALIFCLLFKPCCCSPPARKLTGCLKNRSKAEVLNKKKIFFFLLACVF